MGLTSPLIPALVCLLACTSNLALARCTHNIVLKEIIYILKSLTEKKDACLDMTVADVFAVPKNTTEKETFCRTAVVLQQVHACLPKYLNGITRNLRCLTNMTSCPVEEARKSTLRDLLENLKSIMREKFANS
ncbi:interleukin-4 [Suncus etruscus]|uniref:interleukin-4 n=1 Tax=Suncus etruscus TaxID=109475 RepID=UPI002110CF70|nr:interleukin-4 [Suncus etruscus]